MITANLIFEIFIFLIAIAVIIILLCRICKTKSKLNDISEILDDIAKGNINRKIFDNPNDVTSVICYKINDIVDNFKNKMIEFKKTDETNKQLMTNLSHDVRTPLTTLIGYLDAVHKGIVAGEEKEEYIEIARNKAYDMKEYVDVLFEWFKMNSNEETFKFEDLELTDVTRNILKDWIPIFENTSLEFDIDIPERSIIIKLDSKAYSRILSNLIQNVIYHSRATHIYISISNIGDDVQVIISDNGKGISKQDLPHIFERLYKCDKARSEKGSGLGLSIVKQLVEKMNGMINVESEPNIGTKFSISFHLPNENK